MTAFCEWNPKDERALFVEEKPHAEATVAVGASGHWHLCDACVSLPMFVFLKRRPLTHAEKEAP